MALTKQVSTTNEQNNDMAKANIIINTVETIP